jgi:hypothetical protein
MDDQGFQSLPPIPWALSLKVKWLVHEGDHSPPSNAQVKECMELYLHCLNTPSWCGAQLKHKKALPKYDFQYRNNIFSSIFSMLKRSILLKLI